MSTIQLKQEIDRRWILTYFDKSSGIIKFRSKIKLNTWGFGTVLKVDTTNRQIKAISYPMMGTYTHKGNGIAKEASKTIKAMIYNLYI